MKKFLEKKQWMMLALVAALGVAVYLNYYFTKEPALSAGGLQAASAEASDTLPDDAHLGEASYVSAGVSEVSKTGTDTSQSTAAATYFDKARASRTAARDESVRLLEELLGSAQATAEQKQTAQKQATAIAENVLQESNIENLILAKGFADCVVFIDGDHASVVVASTDLQQKESLQILQIVVSQSGVEAKNVQISTPQTQNPAADTQ